MNPLVERGLKAETQEEAFKYFELLLKCIYYRLKIESL